MLEQNTYERYTRHLSLPEIGIAGQELLQAASVLCVGLGGLGSPAALYLAAAGIGRIGLVDADHVTLSNLQRQIIHQTENIGQKKVTSAAQALQKLNPEIQIELFDTELSASNGVEIASSYDLILDGSDNFPTRYLCNDLGFFLQKPVVYGSIYRFQGECSLFDPHQGGPCYRCLFPAPPPAEAIPNCSEAGVLGVLPGIIGTLQATETLRYFLKIGNSLRGKLLHYDALEMQFKTWHLRPDPECPLCGKTASIRKLIDETASCDYTPTMNRTDTPSIPTISVEELATLLQQQRENGSTPSFRLIDVREPMEYQVVYLEEATLIPLQELLETERGLDKTTPTYLHCKSGGRSAHAVQELQKKGYHNLYNVAGGIKAWVEKIDPSLPTYW